MDRRALWAIVLMTLILVVPSLFLKKPPASVPAPAAAPLADAAAHAAAGARDSAQARADTAAAPVALPSSGAPAGAAGPADTLLVRSPLASYAVSTVGARILGVELAGYGSMAPGDGKRPAELVRPGDALLGLTLVNGRDTIPLDRWTFTASDSGTVTVAGGPKTVHFTGSRNGMTVDLAYTFRPDDYRVAVSGQVRGMGQDGGFLLVGLGHGLRNTEADSNDNQHAYAFVTKGNGGADRTDFGKLDAGETRTVGGPFEWVAVKSKYFVAALFDFDSTAKSNGGRITGVTATAPASAGKRPTTVAVRASVPVPGSGSFGYSLYAGPMKYDHLAKIGHEFDDVNPYGWPGFRTVIRFFAVPVRALLVWMHDHLNLTYGVVLILFGIGVRIILWPLNQKAMRSSMAMQALQPELKRLQERYANEPQKQQQEMFKLYKEHGVNPLGGCWPMLLPMPVLLALFFVFQNSIELRGTPFLWVPDLAQHDPLLIIPIVMGLSMFVLSKVGQIGMEPNPQAKMMLYVMPVMMTFFFWRLAAGLNLYYAVSNIASIPQQWLLAKERKRRAARMIVDVKTKAPAKTKK